MANVAEALTLSEKLMHSTVRIECFDQNGRASSGTGFFFCFFQVGQVSVPVIVTNKHVVQNSTTGRFYLTLAAENGMPAYGQKVQIDVNLFEQGWIGHPNPAVDLTVFPAGDILAQLQQRGQTPFWVGLDPSLIWNDDQLRDLTPIEEVITVGYPNGIWDSHNNLPVIRRGITATPVYIDREGRSEFLIDAAVFPGSSGSPVFLFNQNGWQTRNGGTALGGVRVALLGIIHSVMIHQATGEIRIEHAPTTTRPVPISNMPNNLGVCVKAHHISDFESVLLARGVVPPSGYISRDDRQAPA